MSTPLPDAATAAALRAEISVLAEQERLLQLPRLQADFAWALGSALRADALALGQPITIEVRLGAETLFLHAMPGTTAANADWARRKRNVVELLGQSSYRVGRQLALEGSSLEAKLGLATRDYAPHGGSVPLGVAGLRLGTVTVSGLPQRQDHEMVVAAIARLGGLALPALPG